MEKDINRKIILKLLREKFSKVKTIIPDHCGVLTAADSTTFASLQLLYYSISLANRVAFTVIDLGMSEAQNNWCCNQGIHYIGKQNLSDKPAYLRFSPFKSTLWLTPQHVVFDKLDTIFQQIDQHVFIVENPSNQEPITQFHITMKTNLIPHHAGPPNIHAHILGIQKDRDQGILDRWTEAISACDDETTCLQWAIEVENQLNNLVPDTWNKEIDIPVTKVQDTLEALIPNCQIAQLKTMEWEGEVPLDFQPDNFPEISMPNLASKCTIFVIPYNKPIPVRTHLRPIMLDDFPKELGDTRIFLSPELHVGTDYVGIMPGNLNEKYKRLHWSLENCLEIESQLRPNRVLTVEVAPPHWAEISEKAYPGILPILKEIAKQENYNLVGTTVAGMAFVCRRSIFERLLEFWERAYEFLLNKPENVISPFIYYQITMIFFANCKQEIVPIFDRYVKRVMDDDTPYHICRFNGIVEAKFFELTQAEGYCEHNRYRFDRRSA